MHFYGKSHQCSKPMFSISLSASGHYTQKVSTLLPHFRFSSTFLFLNTMCRIWSRVDECIVCNLSTVISMKLSNTGMRTRNPMTCPIILINATSWRRSTTNPTLPTIILLLILRTSVEPTPFATFCTRSAMMPSKPSFLLTSVAMRLIFAWEIWRIITGEEDSFNVEHIFP